MSDAIPAGKTVHWIGTGLSSGSGLRVLAERAPRVLVWGRTEAKAEQCLARLGLCDRAGARTYDRARLAEELHTGDIVVSMLPATEHVALLRLCIERNAHFACSSYVSEAILAEVPAAAAAGLVVLTEAGLDPGIDHLFADLLVARGREVVGDGPAMVEFTSYCGGVPAVPNEFRYRFSWAPRGVLGALLAPARYIDEGAERTVALPWTATRPHVLNGETFEVYPNRDSVPYLTQYALPDAWQARVFVRGTLRLDGWLRAWEDVFGTLRTGDGAHITALADELAARHPTTDADRDRVILAVALDVRGANGRSWRGEYVLDAIGEATESAMARCVSLPLAYGVSEILDGRAPAGLRQAAEDAEDARRWLAFLSANGVDYRFAETTRSAPNRDQATQDRATPAEATRDEPTHAEPTDAGASRAGTTRKHTATHPDQVPTQEDTQA
ncbi:saccharopine dehydrogenase family protein [Embleya sp. NPDC005575]|uniref:saccharopine dehydrogenase family protein n=1 Tax=Embleya sp. NPDC005575 TaxID=3156892 RepID=UPI0033BE1978